MNSLTFLYIVYFYSIGFQIITIILALLFVIPMQMIEYKVNDRLAILRKQLLYKGILALIVATASTIALSSRFFITDIHTIRYVISTMILLHAISSFLKTLIDYKIYHQDYPTDKIDKLRSSGKMKK